MFWANRSFWARCLICVGAATALLGLAAGALQNPLIYTNAAWIAAKLVRLKPAADSLKVIVESLAYASAGAYFLYRLTSGYFIADLSLKLTFSREPNSANASQDFLAVTAELKSAGHGTIRLRDVQAHASNSSGFAQTQPSRDIERLKCSKDKIAIEAFHSVEGDGRYINLAPGESTQLSFLFEVPSALPCFVQIAVFGIRFRDGNRPRLGIMQWRASCVALPPRPQAPARAA